MGEIHVQFESLATGEQDIRNSYSRLSATLEQLESDLAPLIRSWSGAAQEAYLACKQQWEDAALTLAAVLNNIGTAVGQAHDNYAAAENAARSNWS